MFPIWLKLSSYFVEEGVLTPVRGRNIGDFCNGTTIFYQGFTTFGDTFGWPNCAIILCAALIMFGKTNGYCFYGIAIGGLLGFMIYGSNCLGYPC